MYLQQMLITRGSELMSNEFVSRKTTHLIHPYLTLSHK